jgi:hypothetical protein
MRTPRSILRCVSALARILLLGVWLPALAHAAEYHVATNGSDAASGANGAPWRTIQYAMQQAVAGDRILVHVGAYGERVRAIRSGVPGFPITLRAASNETAALDGSSLTVGEGADALLTLAGVSHLIVEGLEIRSFRTAAPDHNPMGVFVAGAASDLVLRKLRIHGIEANYDDGGAAVSGADAHGLAVYGSDGVHAISNLLIDAVEIWDCRLGSSEAMVLNGNVDGFEVRDCRVHDVNNIGIDFIGFEGVCPVPSRDQARHGRCVDNRVERVNTTGNPAYRSAGGYDRSAAGIYVDGARDIVIERNIVADCDFGCEIGAENAAATATGIAVRNNVFHGCHGPGLALGGYDALRGQVTDCTVLGNTFHGNDRGLAWSGEIHLQWHVTDCVFENNVLFALANAGGSTAVLVGGPGEASALPQGVSFDYNLHQASVVDRVWSWGAQEFSTYPEWTSSGQDAHGLAGLDPQFLDAAAGDFHVAPGSPLAGRGHGRPDLGERDLDGEPRVVCGGVDMGADEIFQPRGALLEGAVDVGGGWQWSTWFGFVHAGAWPWLYHAEHHWLYTFCDDAAGALFWDASMGSFWWTEQGLYPALFRFADQAWLWYLPGSANPRWFFNFSRGDWEVD